MKSSALLIALLVALPALAQEDDDRVEIAAPNSNNPNGDAGKAGKGGRHVITKEEHKEAVKVEKARQKADAEAQAKADAEAKAKADAQAKVQAAAEVKAKMEEDRKRLAAQEKQQKEESARLAVEQKKVDAELKKQEALKAKEAELTQKRADLDARKKKLEEAKRGAGDMKKAARQAELDQKKLDAEAKRLEQEEAKQSDRLAAQQKKVQQDTPPASEKTRRVLQPGQATAYLGPTESPAPSPTPSASPSPVTTSAAPAARAPATATPVNHAPAAATTASTTAIRPEHSIAEAHADPRFRAGPVIEDAQVKVTSIGSNYAYTQIPDNGCSAGKSFVTGQLVAPFDGKPAEAVVVLRIDDLTLGPVHQGGTLAFSGLRRAGRAEDGTGVYCGKGTAFPVRR